MKRGAGGYGSVRDAVRVRLLSVGRIEGRLGRVKNVFCCCCSRRGGCSCTGGIRGSGCSGDGGGIRNEEMKPRLVNFILNRQQAARPEQTEETKKRNCSVVSECSLEKRNLIPVTDAKRLDSS